METPLAIICLLLISFECNHEQLVCAFVRIILVTNLYCEGYTALHVFDR